ncbi:hypothetical protein TOL_0341 [Thalassolituus oleivorans MIL-1]|uniref:Uncharacterized protein n=1 Tax=Thalassolituus oleivorans MIL-1 TaxID=1298593 RepID=M5DZ31_9GAMM|nr:hypothetical protein TOL_0341 [Thalassolituus oleivorans MIL-1]
MTLKSAAFSVVGKLGVSLRCSLNNRIYQGLYIGHSYGQSELFSWTFSTAQLPIIVIVMDYLVVVFV